MLCSDRTDVSKGIDVNKKANQKSAIFVTIEIFQIKILNFNHMYPVDDLLTMSMNHSDIVILNIKGADYCCIISAVSKMKP